MQACMFCLHFLFVWGKVLGRHPQICPPHPAPFFMGADINKNFYNFKPLEGAKPACLPRPHFFMGRAKVLGPHSQLCPLSPAFSGFLVGGGYVHLSSLIYITLETRSI